MLGWEIVFEDSAKKTERMKVPGGWLVLTSTFLPPTDLHKPVPPIAQTFLPDPKHNWQSKYWREYGEPPPLDNEPVQD